MKKRTHVAFGLVAAVLTVAAPAWASFPGENGRIVFSSNRVFPPEIYSMNDDGTGLRRLTWNTAQDLAPRVSPDGNRIVFARTVSPTDQDIWIMNADGTGERRLTSGPERDDQPVFSKDGERVVFQRVGGLVGFPAVCPCEIRVVGVDGTGQRLVDTGPGDAANPDVSRYGKLAFAGTADGTLSIYMTDLHGGPIKRVTHGPAAFGDFRPRWSPRGNEIVFMRNELGSLASIDIWMVDKNGSDLRRLTTTERVEEAAQWSPDGTRIVFTVLEPLPPFGGRLFTMDPNGRNERMLPQLGTPFVDTFDDGRDDAGVWHTLAQGGGVTSVETGGRVVTSVAAGAIPFDGPGYRALETHTGLQCTAKGDYAIAVDYELLHWPAENGFQVSLGSFFADDFIWRESRPGAIPSENYFAFADGLFGTISTADSRGSLRIVRANGVVTASYLAHGVWVPLLTSTSVGDAVVGFQLADYNFFTGKGVSAAFDNFRIDSGELTCPSRWRDTTPDWAVG